MNTRPTKVGHVVYRTRRFEDMQQWCQTVFNAHVLCSNPAIAFLTFDGEHHRLAILNMVALPPNGQEKDRQGVIGVDHVGYSFGSVRDLLDNYARLREESITPYWCIHHGITVAPNLTPPSHISLLLKSNSIGPQKWPLSGPSSMSRSTAPKITPTHALSTRTTTSGN